MSLEVKDQNIKVIYKNIENIEVKFYLVDIEILFSRNPFIQGSSNSKGVFDSNNKLKVDFDFVVPYETKNFKLDKKREDQKLEIEIPDNLKNKNVMIEVISGSLKEYDIYYSSLLQCSVIESIGEIKIMDKNLKPIPKVYVKCFCKTKNGSIKFYKDGYTDLRGKFDYISLNNDLINNADKFSILMISKEFGSLIKICNPAKIIIESTKEGTDNDTLTNFFNQRNIIRNLIRTTNVNYTNNAIK